jgi:energy-coupling factor transport system permease protein
MLPPGIGTPGPTAWHRLDPLTRLTVSGAATVGVIVLGGLICPMLLALAAVVVPAIVTRASMAVLRLSFALALPLAVSAALVNVVFPPSGTVITALGPARITEEGLWVAAEVVIRVFVMAGAVTLFYLTTRPGELVESLLAHGAPPRLAFVIQGGVAMVPRLADRAAEVAAAQRARGLDSEGALHRRVRGMLAVAGPTVLGAVAEAEARTLALETRAFTRPGSRAQLWVPADSALQRIGRWSIVVALGVAVVLRASGALPC